MGKKETADLNLGQIELFRIEKRVVRAETVSRQMFKRALMRNGCTWNTWFCEAELSRVKTATDATRSTELNINCAAEMHSEHLQFEPTICYNEEQACTAQTDTEKQETFQSGITMSVDS